MNVVILHEAVGADARADELDVLDQVAAVAEALASLGHDHQALPMTGDLFAAERQLQLLAPDLVFNLVESVDGNGRDLYLAPELLERLGLPFTGNGSQATRDAASKIESKRVLMAQDLPTPAWLSQQQLRAEQVVEPGRYILKSVFEHGSLGLDQDCVLFADDAAFLLGELEARVVRFGGSAFAEGYVHGREFNLALLQNGSAVQHLSPAEICFTGAMAGGVRIVGYQAKWQPGSEDDQQTPRSFAVAAADRDLVLKLQALALATWQAFELRGYARVDFRVDERGDPWIIDVNTNPCLTSGAGYAAAVQESGLSFAQAIEQIVATATFS